MAHPITTPGKQATFRKKRAARDIRKSRENHMQRVEQHQPVVLTHPKSKSVGLEHKIEAGFRYIMPV